MVNAMMPENQSNMMKASLKWYLSFDMILSALKFCFLIYKTELIFAPIELLLRIKLNKDDINYTRVSSKWMSD